MARSDGTGSGRLGKRLWVALLVALSVLVVSPSRSTADDDSLAFRDLATGSDYRVRVAAALALGKSRPAGARVALERALGDAHPAVRAAASAALGALGDSGAIAALKDALSREGTESVRAQFQSTIRRLSGGSSSSAAAKFLVSVGRMDLRPGVNGSVTASAFKQTTRTRVARIPGVEVVADGSDVAAMGKSRNLPALAIDGSLTQLQRGSNGGGVSYSARVEYIVRKMPEHALKGTMSGSAQAAADAQNLPQGDLEQLQSDAVEGAVESAFKGASPVLEAATH